jgi:hypothetical protein
MSRFSPACPTRPDRSNRSGRRRAGLVAAMVCGAGCSLVAADIRHVPAQYPTIQAAIDAAAAGDTVLVAGGQHAGFTLTKNLTVRGSGGAQACTIISAVEIVSAAAHGAVVQGFTIDGQGQSAGPGLSILHADPFIIDCTVQGWRGRGIFGGVHLLHSSARLIDCTIRGNTFGEEALVQEDTGGGGLAAYGGSPRLVRCIISDNTTVQGQAVRHAHTHSGGHGGGLFFKDSSPTLVSCTISGNHTGDGGSDPGCDQFYQNGPGTDGGSGGGIHMLNSSGVLINCIIAGNRTGSGGQGGECPPRSGGSGGSGGALYVRGGAAVLINCTVADNSTGTAGAGPAGAGSQGAGGGIRAVDAAVRVHNSIVWGNIAPGAGELLAQIAASAPAQVAHSCIMGMGGANGNLAADPAFMSAEEGDYRLASSSPCVDAGNNDLLPAWVTTDVAGLPRLHSSSSSAARVDVGAHEFQGSTCYANCDGSTMQPVLNVEDFVCFINQFVAGDPRANCDQSTSPPVLNVQDFVCFVNQFYAGCE